MRLMTRKVRTEMTVQPMMFRVAMSFGRVDMATSDQDWCGASTRSHFTFPPACPRRCAKGAVLWQALGPTLLQSAYGAFAPQLTRFYMPLSRSIRSR